METIEVRPSFSGDAQQQRTRDIEVYRRLVKARRRDDPEVRAALEKILPPREDVGRVLDRDLADLSRWHELNAKKGPVKIPDEGGFFTYPAAAVAGWRAAQQELQQLEADNGRLFGGAPLCAA